MKDFLIGFMLVYALSLLMLYVIAEITQRWWIIEMACKPVIWIVEVVLFLTILWG